MLSQNIRLIHEIKLYLSTDLKGITALNLVCYGSISTGDKMLIFLLNILESISTPVQITSFVSTSILLSLLLVYFISPCKKDLQIKCTMLLVGAMIVRLAFRQFFFVFRESSAFNDRTVCGIIGKVYIIVIIYNV